MGIAETKIYPINTGWLEADLGTYIFWKGPERNIGILSIVITWILASIKS